MPLLSRRLVLSALALSPAARAARSPDAAGDVHLLGEVLRTLHPGLLRYQSAAAFEAALHRLEAPFAAAADLRTQALLLSRFLAGMRCGHTYVNPYNQRGAARRVLVDEAPPLPVSFRWLNGRAVVTGGALPAGEEIVSLNGRPMATVRDTLLPLVRADGHNLHAALALLQRSGDDEIETFDVLHAMAYGAAPAWRLGLRTRTRSLPATAAARPPVPAPSDDAPPWPLRELGGGAVLLTMPGWAAYRWRWDWQAYLGRVFAQIRDARHLVIDLRGNEGGLDCGDAILAHLIDAPLDTRLTERRLRARTVPAHVRPHLDTWDPSFFDRSAEALEPLDGGFWRQAEPGSGRIEPIASAGPRFRGQVSVLCDGSNHSATFRFLQLLRKHRAGRPWRLVGEPTGGNQRGINGGAFFFLRLPGSGLEVDIPLIGTFAPEGTPDAGLLPDVLVQPTSADLRAGRDAVLQAALRGAA